MDLLKCRETYKFIYNQVQFTFYRYKYILFKKTISPYLKTMSTNQLQVLSIRVTSVWQHEDNYQTQRKQHGRYLFAVYPSLSLY
jgi:hypothetical protein